MTDTSSEENPAKLQRFLIFNSSWGPKEGEEEKKIVYYFPEEDADKTKHVGLIEALVRFMSVFSQNPAKFQHTQKSKSVFAQVESGFWMSMTVSAPYKIKKSDNDSSSTEISYYGDKLHDNVLEAKLKRAYDLFKIFTGGFQLLDTAEAIKAKAEGFFSRYIPNLHFNHCDNVNDLFGAVQFLTLEPLDFLHVKSFVNKVEGDFGCVDKSLFLHHGNIVWSGVQQKETQLLYFYVYQTLLPATGLATAAKTSANSTSSPFGGHQGRFLTGPTQLDLTVDEVNSLRIPKVYIPHICQETHLEAIQEYHLLVYHAIKSTLCLLIPSEVSFTVDFFKRLDGHLGPRLTNMSADLLDVFGRNAGSSVGANVMASEEISSILSPSICVPPVVIDAKDEDTNVVYYNEANKAMKNTLTNQPQLEALQHGIADLNQDLCDLKKLNNIMRDEEQKITSELAVKLPNEDWIVGRHVDQRQIYLGFKQKNSLLEVDSQVDKVMLSEFKNICLPP